MKHRRGTALAGIIKSAGGPLALVLAAPALLFAADAASGSEDMGHMLALLVFEIGLIILCSRIGGMLFARLRLPSVLGELFAGVIIGPHLLGAIPLPGFPSGLFPPVHDSPLPVSTELYALCSMASVILLFMSGLETDIGLFLRYSVAGAVVGIGGVVASYTLGVLAGVWLLHLRPMDPSCMYLGIIGTATSVGITARILSERRKIDSPEGTTILAGAVIDDVLGIIGLAVVASITAVFRKTGSTAISWGPIELITIKALGIWLFFTVAGLVFAHRVSAFLKLFKEWISFSIVAMGLAFILAGVFEKAGLSMIIGAYIMGLTLSKTDLGFVIQNELRPLYAFFVPIFFTVMGMLVDVKLFANPEIIVFGIFYTILAVLAKLFGCGVPALFLNFNRLGALRIGLGMVPRGEVALIIAGIGLSQGFLSNRIFGAAIVMTIITTLIAPVMLDFVIRKPRKGSRREPARTDEVITLFGFDSPESTDFVLARLVEALRNENFFVHLFEARDRIYQVRKNGTFFSVEGKKNGIEFESRPEDVALIKTVMFEVLQDIYLAIDKLKKFARPEEFREGFSAGKHAAEAGDAPVKMPQIGSALTHNRIVLSMTATDKAGAIGELLDAAARGHAVRDRARALEDLQRREATMSTGMENGIALPHAKTGAVARMVMAVGLCPRGIDFTSLDGKPSTIFIMLLIPPDTSHLEMLAAVGKLLQNGESRERLLRCRTQAEVYRFFTGD